MNEVQVDPGPELASVRRELAVVDRALVDLIARRCRLARDAGAHKHDQHLPLVDPRQEAAVVRRSGARARALGVEEEAVRGIFWQLIELSRRQQEPEHAHGRPGGAA